MPHGLYCLTVTEAEYNVSILPSEFVGLNTVPNTANAIS
jgi:hypothetical protein